MSGLTIEGPVDLVGLSCLPWDAALSVLLAGVLELTSLLLMTLVLLVRLSIDTEFKISSYSLGGVPEVCSH